jgi:predicted small metal-binding protein
MVRYYIDCRDVGWQDCSFSTEAGSVEQVIEQCADHARAHHNLKGFGQELYGRMRPHIRQRDAGTALNSPTSQ